MSLFGRVTQGDLEELRHALELLHISNKRLQAVAKAQAARNAGFNRRLSAIESLIRDAPVVDETQDIDDEDTENGFDKAEEKEDIETQRLRLRGK
jgi:hypothetical protein